ncbi:MAG: outer membrane lipoprotein-sorting protein [Thermoflexibacter sp.]|jgi:outer membrane lipoprotein-sorting protein|nr:outer membrane lipoprotein-sorting protein [Thermoflexibacter sp.]
MKMVKKVAMTVFAVLVAFSLQAQTAEEVINKYLENIGGKDKWKAVKSMKTTGKGKQSNFEFPMTMVQAEGGKQKISFNFQGKEITQMAFDGNTGWTTNMMTMKAEKMEAEDSENLKKAAADFPDPFIDYAEKGYKVELEGKEKVEGTECFKIKLTKKPEMVEGKEVENVVYYFFDAENYVPLVVKTTVKKGQAKGAVVETIYSDYQEVNGLFFPFSMSQKYNGQVAFSLTFEKIEINVSVDEKEFAMPSGN